MRMEVTEVTFTAALNVFKYLKKKKTVPSTGRGGL
jgi:hypothetical protein